MIAHLRTPLLVNVNREWEDYLAALDKPAKKNFNRIARDCFGISYWRREFSIVEMTHQMSFWETQIGRRWAFGPAYFNHINDMGALKIFATPAGEIYHPVEHFGNYIYCQPVIYNKVEFPDGARFMWFNLIRWACFQPQIEWVDLGGGFHGSWVDFLKNREAPQFRYKWQFVDKATKENPDDQRPYYALRCTCGYKCVVTECNLCPHCGGSCTSGR